MGPAKRVSIVHSHRRVIRTKAGGKKAVHVKVSVRKYATKRKSR